MMHGISRVTLAIMKTVSKTVKISAVITESRVDAAGHDIAEQLTAQGIPCTIIPDAAVAYVCNNMVDINSRRTCCVCGMRR